MMKKPKLTPWHIAIYLALLFALWSVRELVIQPALLSPLDNVRSEIIGGMIKLLVWTLPAVILIKHFHADMWIGLKEMFVTKPTWFKDAPMLLLVFVPALQALLSHRAIGIDPDFDPSRLLGGVLFVGITEEIVFRGFLLNALLKKLTVKPAIALNEVFFVLIHYPIWIYRGMGAFDILTSSVMVFVIGAFFSYAFVKTKNIFVPIALHMIWNLLVIALYM